MDSFSPVILQPLFNPPLSSELTVNREYLRLENLFTGAEECTCVVPDSGGGVMLSVSEDSSISTQREVDRVLGSCCSVAVTLLFSDNTTQLDSVKQPTDKDIQIEALCIAASHQSVLYLINLHFVPLSSAAGLWIKDLLTRVLSSTRIVGYQLNEVLCILVAHFKIPDDCVLSWSICDVGLACLLLPNNTATISNTYQQLLAQYNIQQQLMTPSAKLGSIINLLTSTHTLMDQLYHSLCSNGLWGLFTGMEMKILPLVAAMESHGIGVDVDLLKKYEEVLKIKATETEESIYSLVGHSFAINSVQQLRKILYEDLKLDQTCPTSLNRTTVYKHMSTSEATLIMLQDYHPLPKLILEYRQVCKLKALLGSLITHAISNNATPLNDQERFHFLKVSFVHFYGSAYHNAGLLETLLADHGIIHWQDDMLQPGAGTHTVDIRAAIIPRQNYSFVVSDFRSIELCLLAHISGDCKLISVLNHAKQTGEDIFELLASEWLGTSHKSVSQKEREKTKRVVYSLIYGMGREKLSQILGVSPESAQRLTASFLSQYSGVKRFITNTIEQCQKTNLCSTLCGRLRWFDAINSTNFMHRTTAERQCVNFVIQGSAADVSKLSMLKVHEVTTKKKINARLLIQVHDELVYEVEDKDTKLVMEQLKETMGSKYLLADYIHTELLVPLSVKIFVGKRWSTN